jgi:hypothetical protein
LPEEKELILKFLNEFETKKKNCINIKEFAAFLTLPRKAKRKTKRNNNFMNNSSKISP